MKRRDFLKQGGVAVLGAPAAASLLAGSASSLTAQASGKDLVISFTGPFCFWWNTPSEPSDKPSIKVMVPPVGPCYPLAPHQPWFGTSQNEKPITTDQLKANGINFSLELPGYSSPKNQQHNQLAPFVYTQGGESDTGATPLFNLSVPPPNTFIGVRRTMARMKCAEGITDPYCNEYMYYASGVNLVYKNVDVKAVRIMQGNTVFFQPCFENDVLLPTAGLGINVSSLQPPNHDHATTVWSQMLAMYPWMSTEITGIEFCDFDASVCDDLKLTQPERHQHSPILAGTYGNDCQAPNMCLLPPQSGTSGATQKKKY